MRETSEPAAIEILTFWIGPFILGVEATQIAWLPATSATRVAEAARESSEGLSVIDLRSICGLDQLKASGRQPQILVIERGDQQVAYAVDRIGDLITVDIARDIWPLPPLIMAQRRWQQLWGVCQWDDELVVLVDLGYDL